MVGTTTAVTAAPIAPQAARPAPPPARSRRATFRKWRARFVVLVLVLAAAYSGFLITQSKAGRAAQIDLGTVTLTSQVVPVETPRPGQVLSVDVAAAEKVTAGQQLGTIQVTTADSDGEAVLSTIALSAPRTGIVVDDPVTVGSTLQPGQPFVELYDPTKLTFEGQVPLTDLSELSAGMVATLEAEGLNGSVSATVQRAVPRVGTSQTDVKSNSMRIVLVPTNGTDVTRLVPGLRFTGTVDTGTGPPDRPKLVYVVG
jgi:multidrug resistance efflux pump